MVRRGVRIPAFSEFPIINVVHPAYHAFPKGGHGNFAASGNRRFNCILVFANSAGYVIAAESLVVFLNFELDLFHTNFDSSSGGASNDRAQGAGSCLLLLGFSILLGCRHY